MRIVGGAFRGTRLNAPAGRDIRPTSDRARESLFNILAHGFEIRFPETDVVDLFAGTGALGIEALSRGARTTAFIDSATAALKMVRDHLERVRATDRAAVLRADARALPAARAACALAFLDPPYGQGLAEPALRSLAARGWLADGALCVVETGAKEDLAPPVGFALEDDRAYGVARLRFLRYRPER